MYSTDQLQLLRDLQKKNTLLLYLDATGTVVAKPNACKRVLYYALYLFCYSNYRNNRCTVSEMLSSDQSTPSLQHGLTCFTRDFFKMFKQHLQPDFSWAIIHACVLAFCQNDVHMYLHICAAHMTQILFCKTSKVKCAKATKDLFLFDGTAAE